MSTFRTIIASFALLLSFQLNAQTENAIADLNFMLKMMDDQYTWGVFVVPGPSITPTKRVNTGTGQVTIVAPFGFAYAGLENISGTWIENARVDGPMEAPSKSYISFGFVSDEPRIKYQAGKETLLFTFIPENGKAEFSLINNETDPFATPNTYGSNPGNELGVIDFGHGGMIVYNYGHNLDSPTTASTPIANNKKTPETKEGKEEFKAIFTSDKISTPNN